MVAFFPIDSLYSSTWLTKLGFYVEKKLALPDYDLLLVVVVVVP